MLASRDNLCINKKARVNQRSGKTRQREALNDWCRKSKCSFKPNLATGLFKKLKGKAKLSATRDEVPTKPMDIEEIHRWGIDKKCCPYYLSRLRVDKSEIVLMSYNNILDEKIRNILEFDLEKDVIIFDEAHNIPEFIEESSSFVLDEITLRRVLMELKKLNKFNDNKKKAQDQISKVMMVAGRFLDFLKAYNSDSEAIKGPIADQTFANLPKDSIVLPGDRIFDIFFKLAPNSDD